MYCPWGRRRPGRVPHRRCPRSRSSSTGAPGAWSSPGRVRPVARRCTRDGVRQEGHHPRDVRGRHRRPRVGAVSAGQRAPDPHPRRDEVDGPPPVIREGRQLPRRVDRGDRDLVRRAVPVDPSPVVVRPLVARRVDDDHAAGPGVRGWRRPVASRTVQGPAGVDDPGPCLYGVADRGDRRVHLAAAIGRQDFQRQDRGIPGDPDDAEPVVPDAAIVPETCVRGRCRPGRRSCRRRNSSHGCRRRSRCRRRPRRWPRPRRGWSRCVRRVRGDPGRCRCRARRRSWRGSPS